MREVSSVGGGLSGDLSLALAPTDQHSIRVVIRQDILAVPNWRSRTFLEMVSSQPSGLEFKSPRKGRVVPSRRLEPQLKFFGQLKVPAIGVRIDTTVVLALPELLLTV